MPDERTNLLPPERQRAVRRDYFSRLGIVALALALALVCVAAVLLVPTYVFLVQSSRAKEALLSTIESTLSSSDEKALAAQLAALSESAAALSKLSVAPSASGTIRAALAIARPGIALSGFGYSPVADKKSGTLEISGSAATRDALRTYQLALSSAPFARSADLPVSAYAKDSNITFTITVTLAP